ncbi:MAG: hypothetical protein ABXS91_07865 [Sulfurimonas sp.]
MKSFKQYTAKALLGLLKKENVKTIIFVCIPYREIWNERRNSDGNIKVDNGKPVMTINMDLLRSNARQKEIKNNYNMDLQDIQGGQR